MKPYKRILSSVAVAAIAFQLSYFPVNAATGVDVYHGDGYINWVEVRSSGVTFAYLKALDGERTYDSRYQENRKNASAAGLDWGPYQFFHPYSVESAETQAENFWSLIKNTGYTLTPAVDVEVRDGVSDAPIFRERLSAFLNKFEALSGVKPVIYTMRSFITGSEGFNMPKYYSQYKLWQADPDRSSPVQTGWPISIWQYTWSGQVPGISAPGVDIDVTLDGTGMGTVSSAQENTEVDSSDYYHVSKLPQQETSIAKDDFYIRDHNGARIGSHQIDSGDPFIILNVDYSTQLAEVLYPNYAQNGWYHGYIKNIPSLYHSVNYNAWSNGSTNEPVYSANGSRIGTIYPSESATVLNREGQTKLLYTTGKGPETKTGFVNYAGK